ncbi:hypothetical protein F4779DRAFT_612891 [Xylariaceae sp. FL0662B]|nr:hypothetical protein F4779DRAFT_612891 [Xylariaceae sp. FL0662B]
MSKSSKATQYLLRLEDARCEGKWDDVPELVRKVRKHATDRLCLTTTVETEYAIVKASQKQRPESRPTTAVSSEDLEVGQILPKLLEAIEGENTFLEDKYQAQVCVGWLHWTIGEYNLASVRLPGNLETELVQLDQPDGISEWTRVCSLKAAYLKANCHSRNNERVEALAIFESALSSLSYVWSGQKGRKQLRFWAELFLTEYCMLQAQALERGDKSLEDTNSLAPFRSWAKYWEVSKEQGTPLAGGFGFRGAVPRRRIWNEYYAAISAILQQDLPFPTGYVNVTNEASARNQLRMELKKVEAAYEGLLLNEISFPRADEERQEVESFVSVVVRNWNVMNGRNWHEYDIGPGGKEGLSRGVLDILYRTATRTFHSTAILRYLFTVHLSVAEFDLAFHALDSYMDIVKKGKARVDKTGHPEPSLDDDATVLETISQAIVALCKYGSQDAAERARGLGVELEQMLQKLPAPLPSTQDTNITTLDEENGNGIILHSRIPSRVYALSWEAIGLSQAQWSRATYDASVRTEIQFKAIRSLQKSLSPEIGNPTDVRTLFTLGLLLAEQRELTAAIDIVKAALMSNKRAVDQVLDAGSYWRERSLIPLWHLLALLLSARQDFIMAARACEGAFEQFDDPTVLFGSQNLQGTFRSEHLNEAEARNGTPGARGLVDEMDDLEKEGIIQVKMTQLALLELLEGPEVAVNASHELLVLYTRLFGSLHPKPLATAKSAMEVPKSSAGTIRSIRGSIFGSKTDKASRNPQQLSPIDSRRPTAPSERPQTTQTTASISTTNPAIQISGENGGLRDSRRSTRSGSIRGRSESTTRRASLKKRDSSTHRRRAVSSSGTSHRASIMDGEDYFTPIGDGAAQERPDFFPWSSKNNISGQQSFPKGRGPLRFDSISSVQGSATGSDNLGLDSLSSPNPLPLVQFPKEQVKRQRQIILIKVWLIIAAFYRRSKMHDDAKGAIDEAKKLVDSLEVDVAKDTSGSVTFRNPGWGGKRSVEELWADVQSELGYLAISEDAPYIARSYFEEALMHFPDHPPAIVGLSNILLDIYSEVLLPPVAVPDILLPNEDSANLNPTTSDTHKPQTDSQKTGSFPALPSTPIGLGGGASDDAAPTSINKTFPPVYKSNGAPTTEELPAPHKAKSLPLVDRLAARDRAYGLLSGLTKLGTGWNYSDAWFALARAHEESGQPTKAKEALWWCIELEEGMGVREWSCVSVNGYVL